MCACGSYRKISSLVPEWPPLQNGSTCLFLRNHHSQSLFKKQCLSLVWNSWSRPGWLPVSPWASLSLHFQCWGCKVHRRHDICIWNLGIKLKLSSLSSKPLSGLSYLTNPNMLLFFFPFIIHQLISWELWLLNARVVFLASTAGSKNWIKSSPAPTFIIERTLPHTPWKEGCSLCVRYNKTLQASWAVFGKSCHWFGYSGPWTLYNSLGRFPRSVLTSVKVALLSFSMLCEFCSCFFSCLVFQTITKQKLIFLITALLVSSFLWIYLLLPQCHLLPQHLSDLPNKF